MADEKLVIIGSGPAAWTAAIYAARAELRPLVYEGAITEPNRLAGTLPLGQLNLTTEVENYPGFPAGNLGAYLDHAIGAEARGTMAPHEGHGVSGPELMELMRQQAKNFGTRIITDDIAKVDFSRRPFRLSPSEGKPIEAQSVIVATGARANYLGLPSEDKYKNHGVSAARCAMEHCLAFATSRWSWWAAATPRSRKRPISRSSPAGSTWSIAATRSARRRSWPNAPAATKKSKSSGTPRSMKCSATRKRGVTGARIGSTLDSGATRELESSGVFLAIGHTPNTAFLENQLELTSKKYIRWTVPFRTNTSVIGVFAAGDVADDYYRQAVTAAGSGCQAALDCERWLAAEGIH